MWSSLALSVALSAVAVPPGAPVVNHAQPAHDAQPTLRTFERRAVDDLRRMQWEAYTQELDGLWKQYRADGSTSTAWQIYKQAAADAKARYIFNDPYLAPVVPGMTGSAWSGSTNGCCW